MNKFKRRFTISCAAMLGICAVVIVPYGQPLAVAVMGFLCVLWLWGAIPKEQE